MEDLQKKITIMAAPICDARHLLFLANSSLFRAAETTLFSQLLPLKAWDSLFLKLFKKLAERALPSQKHSNVNP